MGGKRFVYIFMQINECSTHDTHIRWWQIWWRRSRIAIQVYIYGIFFAIQYRTNYKT